ncbi:hypothetical protein PIROE2DRAFT_5436 [Piromyces sp. E2]|nr:hypothetical protein PIROE2DRAFT_5436 [Piromyces sp. E2]|eukprot:OUM67169.1 hypothetical protein PIROE2DRAFT_5436 [Piromyces sp. E2]
MNKRSLDVFDGDSPEAVIDAIKKYKDIEELSLYYGYGTESTNIQNIIYSISSLKELVLRHCSITSISDSIGNLKNLEVLKYMEDDFNTIPEAIGTLKNLKEFKIGKIPSFLGNLTNLEILDLSGNIIYGELPESLNNLTKLKKIYLQGNLNVRGKILTNDSLDTCVYSDNYSICKVKDMTCFAEENEIKPCSDVTYGELDECEQIHDYLMKYVENYEDIVRRCIVNSEGKAVSITLAYVTDQNYVDNLAKLTNLEELMLYKWGYGKINLDVLKSLKNLVTV